MVWVTASLWTEEVEEQVPYSAFAGVYWSWARVMCVCVCVCVHVRVWWWWLPGAEWLLSESSILQDCPIPLALGEVLFWLHS